MTTATLQIQGVDVFIDGPADQPHAPTVVMIHGWPDTHRLWDASVQALKGRYRCVRFTLPGYELSQPPRPTSVVDMVALFAAIVNKVSPFEPVTLMLHDWGCIFGYEYAALNASRVSRVVGLDVGDHNTSAFHRSLKTSHKLMILAYQMWLAIAWKLGAALGPLGGRLGTWMTRWMARALGCKADSGRISWQMNFPYAMQWFGLLGGFKMMQRVKLKCPMLFIYGQHKPFMFHSAPWLAHLQSQKGSEVHALKTGHWVMLRDPAQFNSLVLRWLNEAPGSSR